MNCFGLCNPFIVTSQIKASKVQVQSTLADKRTPGEIDDEFDDSMEMSLPSHSRAKPKHSVFGKSSFQNLSDEIFSFVMDIRWNYETYQEFEKQLLDARGAFLTYMFDFTPINPKSKLVKILRQEFELNSTVTFVPEDIDNALLSLTMLLENYYEFPDGFNSKSAYNQNCFTSLEYAFICTVSECAVSFVFCSYAFLIFFFIM